MSGGRLGANWWRHGKGALIWNKVKDGIKDARGRLKAADREFFKKDDALKARARADQQNIANIAAADDSAAATAAYDKQVARADKFEKDREAALQQGGKWLGAAGDKLKKGWQDFMKGDPKAKAGGKKTKKKGRGSWLARKNRVQQRLLTKMGTSMKEIQMTVGAEPTGQYDRATFRAIRNFQKKMFPKQRKEWDGLFGPKTLKAVAPNVAAKKGLDNPAAKKFRATAAKKASKMSDQQVADINKLRSRVAKVRKPGQAGSDPRGGK
jgi:hypothetical protein